jgi:uncharacterized membrane protein YphA (DoxX/SURF4 family)
MHDERLILRTALATELVAGAMLAAGLFTPPAGVLLVTIAATLVLVSWPHEYPLYVLFAAVAIALTGGAGILGVGLGVAGAAMIEALRQCTAQRAVAGGSPGSAGRMAQQENP